MCKRTYFIPQVVPWGDTASLGVLQRQLDVDVLVTGHTHRLEACARDGDFFVNPGSATGAFSLLAPAATPQPPSFLLLDVQPGALVIYIYRMIDNDVRVERLEHKKPVAS